MHQTRRTVKKIMPANRDSFDQQFWPIVVALGVLCAIALGAVITILSGPWMWGSLLVLPAATALAFVALFHMDDSRLRRSLQFALLLSLATHLAVLLFASFLNIFENPFEAPRPTVSQRKTRTIEVSNKKTDFIWQQVNEKEVPEPDVEIQKKKTQVDSVPQPIPVKREKQVQPNITPQIVKRQQTASSVPRFDKSLSQMRRSTSQQQPKSSTKSEATPSATTKSTPAQASKSNQAKPTETQTQPKIAATPKASSLKRPDRKTRKAEPTIAVSKREPAAAPSAQAKMQPSNMKRERTDRAQPSEVAQAPAEARMSKPTARVRQREIKTSKQTASSKSMASKVETKQPVEPKPAESSGRLTRRPNRSQVTQTSDTPTVAPKSSPANVAKSSTKRRDKQRALPSISRSDSLSRTPRRATNEARIARSNKPIEMPAPNPSSESATREIQSKTLSVSRSKSGVSGMGNLNNLQRSAGGVPSPAVRPSDSASRRPTQSPAFENKMLTTSQKSTVRRSVAQAIKPTSAFKAETSAAAKISGSEKPELTSLESSAARIDSASTEHRGKLAAEKGEASVDIGPTKIVSEDSAKRKLSGGGAPDVAMLNPERTRRSSEDSDDAPQLAAVAKGAVAAPYSPDSSESAADTIAPSDLARLQSRSGGDSPTTVQRNEADNVGPTTDQGTESLARQFAQSESRRESDANDRMLNSDFEDDEDEEEERRRRMAEARIAQAPTVSRSADPVSGLARAGTQGGADSPDADNPLRAEREDGTESMMAKLTRKSTSSLPGSTLTRSATNMLVQAATSLPIIEGSSKRASKSRSKTGSGRATDPMAATSETTKDRASFSDAVPTINSTADVAAEVPSEMLASDADGSSDAARDLESADVTVSRSTASKSDAGFMLDIVANEGPAGLSDTPDLTVGVNMRPAAEESMQLQPTMENRYRNDDFGGKPTTNPDAVLAKDAFRKRSPQMVKSQAEPTTEAAIHLGLEFLARYQQPDGSWTLTEFDREHQLQRSQLDSDTAATGLAVLAFQGAGYNHREFKYARQVNHGVQWLIKNQGEDGLLYLDADKRSNQACRLYSHGIASLALTEAYGMTQDPELREPAQRALDYIIKTQHPTKKGWRYFSDPRQRSTDTSVSGWMVMALQSGRLSDLDVDDEAFEAITEWLAVAADPKNPSLYRYNPYAVNSQGVSRMSGRKVSTSMTSVGLLMRIYTGWAKDDPRLVAGAQYLVDTQLPSAKNGKVRDTYYWYYATQVLKHVDGPAWEKWNKRLRSLLIRSQEKSGDMAGSWDPYGPVPDRWGQFGGRLYVTTMNLLSLEVRHRMLPLYIKTNSDDKKPKPKVKRKPRVIEGSFE